MIDLEQKRVDDYVFIADHMGVPLQEGETHESVAREMIANGGTMLLWLETRKVWGSDGAYRHYNPASRRVR